MVVGRGFRFGYKASGDTQSLLSLGQHYGLRVSVVDLVAETGTLKVWHPCMASTQLLLLAALKLRLSAQLAPMIHQANRLLAQMAMWQVSSSAVRSALAEGDIDLVSKLLDRRHRLMLQTSGEQRSGGDALARCAPF